MKVGDLVILSLYSSNYEKRASKGVGIIVKIVPQRKRVHVRWGNGRTLSHPPQRVIRLNASW